MKIIFLEMRNKMKITAVLLIMSLVTMICGCTNRNLYESIRLQQEMECQSRPGATPEECSRRSATSYDEYERQIKERQKDK